MGQRGHPGRATKCEGKLIKFNRFFLTTCASLASLNSEFGFPTKKWIIFVDRVTQLWSLVILVTSLIKSLKFPDQQQPLQEQNNKLSDLLLLNYLPRINEFGKLYYGLVCISIGAALVWRVYLNFYRPKCTKHRLKCNFAAPNIDNDNGQAENSEIFDAKCELFEFFMKGPREAESAEKSRLMLSRRRHADAFERLIRVRHVADQLASRYHRHHSLDPVKLARQTGYLSRQHAKSRSSPGTGAPTQLKLTTRDQSVSLSHVYKIPVRSADFLSDHSRARWNHLAKITLTVTAMILTVSVPLCAYCIIGLRSVHAQFALDHGLNLAQIEGDRRIYAGLLVYGILEQAYACSQAAMFFIFTNIFITLFLADLTYKLTPIRREVAILAKLYRTEKVTQLPREEIYRQQLRLWAYFDNIFLLDDFVSKYSVVSMTTLVIGLSFGQSYLKVADPTLKSGTLAALISNFLSFTYLHLISWYIEQRVSRRPPPTSAS